jgi:hypothetical protein
MGTVFLLDKYIIYILLGSCVCVCVWTMCGSLVICGTVSIPSVQGEWSLCMITLDDG